MTTFEEAFADWPKMTVLKNGGVHITGKYEQPGLAKWMNAVWALVCLAALCGLSVALPKSASGTAVGVPILMGIAYPIGVRRAMAWLFSKRVDVKILPDRIQVRSGRGYKNYSRKIPIEFRIEQHRKAIDEELAEARTGKRKPRTYREAVETVMQYGEKRIAIAELPIEEIEQARALAFRLQAACVSPDAAMSLAPQGRKARPDSSAGDFGPSPQIR